LNVNFIVGARAFHGNPYDDHTLNEQIERAIILMQSTGIQSQGPWWTRAIVGWTKATRGWISSIGANSGH